MEPRLSDPTDTDHPDRDGRLKLTQVDVAERPKRRRRNRKRPDPPDELWEWEKEAAKRVRARPFPPNVILEPAGFESEHWTSPHSDVNLWTLQLAEAFGTRSRAVFVTFMRQLEALCDRSHWDEEARQLRLDEHEFSAALAIVNATKPQNEMEAALAAQMVAIHILTMKTAARAFQYQHDTSTAATAGKLARTFAMQIEALQSLRGKKRTTRQSITVRKELHQHVHYHREDGESDVQPHERRAEVIDQCAALPSPEPGGEALQVSGRKRKARLSDSRRR